MLRLQARQACALQTPSPRRDMITAPLPPVRKLESRLIRMT